MCLGVLMTFFVIECFGRKRTMAAELFLFSFFVSLVAICSSRFVATSQSLRSPLVFCPGRLPLV